MASAWHETIPQDAAWRARKGMTPTARAAEQDRAAGGRAFREMSLPDGRTARVSVALRLYKRTRRIRAYLRWSNHGTTNERYVGEVGHTTRAENLESAWAIARTSGLLTPPIADPKRTSDSKPKSWASSPATRAVMRANRGRDTKPEMLLRSHLHAMGLRYRVAQRPIPGLRRTADLVFRAARVAVFVDGCYWHGCPEHHRPARTNQEFWTTKIDGNKRRDAETDRLLTEAEWHVIRIWEHDPVADAAERVAGAVRARRAGRGRVEPPARPS